MDGSQHQGREPADGEKAEGREGVLAQEAEEAARAEEARRQAEDDFLKFRRDPVDAEALRLRLDGRLWPESLPADEPGEIGDLALAFGKAAQVLEAFRSIRTTNAANRHLSEEGRSAANAAWARKHLPELEALLEKVTTRAEKSQAQFIERIESDFMGEHAKLPTELADAVLLGEIRTWIRGLPKHERAMKVAALVDDGDRHVLRAILATPTFLIELDPKVVTAVRDRAMRRAFPLRFQRLEAERKAVRTVQRGLDGVVRHVAHATGLMDEIRPRQPQRAA
jgi:hypothetical protein